MENLSEILSTNTQMELDKVTYAIYVDYQSTLFPTKDKNEIAHGLLIKILALLYAQTKDFPYLYGECLFGDCLEDEWFIVRFLFEISSLFPELVISMSDNDGEFLLIEAANVLPDWISPENSVNRVFVRNGELHIIPLEAITAGDIPTIEQSLFILFKSKISTRADESIQRVLQKRLLLNCQQDGLIHHACALLPIKLINLLNHSPHLISAAVQAFYLRDPIRLMKCSEMKHFPPEPSALTVVKLTRTMYAQLKCQQFSPPPLFQLPSLESKEFKYAELGMKLTCGFEMLCLDLDSKNQLEITRYSEQEMKPYLQEFQNSLNAAGVEIIDPQRSDFWFQRYFNIKEGTLAKSQALYELGALIDNPLLLKDCSNPRADLVDDPDDWLYVDPRVLEESFKSYEPDQEYTSKMIEEEAEFSSESDGELEGGKVTEIVQEFLDKETDYEGVENKTPVIEAEEEETPSGGQKFQYNPNRFMEILNQATGGKSWQEKHSPLYMEEMEQELAESTLVKSFAKQEDLDGSYKLSEGDLEYNMVANFAESIKAQKGLAGPTSNLLRYLDVDIRSDSSDSD